MVFGRIARVAIVVAMIPGCDQLFGLDRLSVAMTTDAPIDNCPSGFLANVCFEDGRIPGPPWDWAASGGSIHIDNSLAARGTYSLRFDSAAAGAGTYTYDELRETTTLPTGREFFRFFVYVPAPFPPTTSITLSAALQSAPPFFGLLVNIDGTGHLQLQNLLDGSARTSSTVLPTATWACVEWEIVSAAGGTGESHLWLDDQALTDADLIATETQPSPAIGWVELGLAPNNPPADIPGLELWIDDIAIADRPIACAE